MRLVPLFALLTSLVVACGGSTDTAVPDEPESMWRVDATPILNITDDGTAADPPLGLVEGVARLPDGSVLVADRGLYALRWFGADGTLQKSLGRKGAGPDEFEYIAGIHRCGDVVYVFDIGRGSTYVGYTVDGTPHPGVQVTDSSGQQNYNTSCNTSGEWMSMAWETRRSSEPGRRRDSVAFWTSAPDGAIRATLGAFPGSERLAYAQGSEPHPLGKQSVLAIGRDRAYVGTADSFLVQVYTLDGAPAGVLRDNDVDLRMTPSDIERYHLLDTLGVPERERDNFAKRGITMEFPPTVPAYDAMLVDTDDFVWIRRYPRSMTAPAEWLVFRSDGTRMATLELPQELTVHEIGHDYIAGVSVDPVDGSQSVRVYALNRDR